MALTNEKKLEKKEDYSHTVQVDVEWLKKGIELGLTVKSNLNIEF